MSKIFGWIKTHKPHTVAILVAIVAVICIIVAAILWAFSRKPAQQEPVTKTAEVTLNVTTDKGWDETSTPAIAHVKGADAATAEVDFYHAVKPSSEGNKGTSTVTLSEGDYTVEFISPLNRDGSVYEMNDTEKNQKVTVQADAEQPLTINCSMTQLTADQVTDELIQALIQTVRAAAESGDDTLKGNAEQELFDQLAQNVSNNLNLSEQIKQEAAEADPEKTAESDSATTEPSQPEQDGNAGSGNTAPDPDTTVNNGEDPGPGSDNAASDVDNTTPSDHTHIWVDHTATWQVWVSNIVTVTDYETKTIYGARFYVPYGDGSYIAKGPTYWFENGFTKDDLKEIITNALKNSDENGLYNGVYYGNYQNVEKTEQIPVGTHQEDQGWYEPQTYVDYQYCLICGQHK